MADARRCCARRLWLALWRHLSADAPARPLGPAKFPEGRSAGARVDFESLAGYLSRTRCTSHSVRRPAESGSALFAPVHFPLGSAARQALVDSARVHWLPDPQALHDVVR